MIDEPILHIRMRSWNTILILPILIIFDLILPIILPIAYKISMGLFLFLLIFLSLVLFFTWYAYLLIVDGQLYLYRDRVEVGPKRWRQIIYLIDIEDIYIDMEGDILLKFSLWRGMSISSLYFLDEAEMQAFYEALLHEWKARKSEVDSPQMKV